MSITQHQAYNALAIFYEGNYRALKNAFAKHSDWIKAFDAARSEGLPDPIRAWSEMGKHNIRLVLKEDDEFPSLLREIPWAPHALYLRGADIADEPKIAIVGTRKATSIGANTAGVMAKECSRAGVTIVSGLAFGIDISAHQATLQSGGVAIAVLASGLDRITPRSNEQIGERIITQGGTLVSEYPVGTKTLPHFFLERNRIVSGLSLGIIVIEAPTRSGTIATARFAVDQNREVFVVPGSITNPNYEGSHKLIKSGAALVTNASEVLEALDLLPEANATNKNHTQHLPFLDETGARIVEVLSAAGTPLVVDAIAERTKLGISVINEALAILTIEGVVSEDGSAYYL